MRYMRQLWGLQACSQQLRRKRRLEGVEYRSVLRMRNDRELLRPLTPAGQTPLRDLADGCWRVYQARGDNFALLPYALHEVYFSRLDSFLGGHYDGPGARLLLTEFRRRTGVASDAAAPAAHVAPLTAAAPSDAPMLPSARAALT